MPARRRISPCLLVAALMAVTSPAPAQASGEAGVPAPAAAPSGAVPQPMVVARMRATGPCGHRCPEWIVAEGILTPNTPGHFREMLDQIGPDKLPVVLESRGGDLDAALAIGRMIRAAGLTTLVGRSEAEGCAPRADCSRERPQGMRFKGYVSAPAECSGTCLLVLAGGVRRVGFGVTGASLPALDSFRTRTRGAQAATLIADYLADMGISAGLVVRLRRGGLALDRSDLQHFGLSTGRERVEDLTGTSICLGAAPAANCLLPQPGPASASAAASPRKRWAARPGVIIWGALD